ncbi:microtubule binding motor protein [Lithospermum erythrorhizon]|uniref:Microtubule binding motor protein n=1 Tax=Lithospermum erythrorhizon TaxID=34254 RepID=A0AAV3P4B5_LITER
MKEGEGGNQMRQMSQETKTENSMFYSPGKNYNMRGFKGLTYNNTETSFDEESMIINDYGLAQRKAEEAATRRYHAAEWLREMDKVALDLVPLQPTEQQFCMALRNGLIFCNVLNKVHPRAVPKVVEIPVVDVQSMEGPAQSAIQYFENMRNFLLALGKMKLLTFEASDLEKGGSSGKVVDCILCLKGYYEWKQAGGIGVWRYGGTVRITSLPKETSSSIFSSESADESLDSSESSQYEQLVDYLHLSSEISLVDSKEAQALAFLFDHFSIGLLKDYLTEKNELEHLPLNSMVIDTLLRKVVKGFTAHLESQGSQLGLFLKRILDDGSSLSKHDFLKYMSEYLKQQINFVSSNLSQFCICGGKSIDVKQNHDLAGRSSDALNIYQSELQELRDACKDAKVEVQSYCLGWEEEHKRLEHHVQGLAVAAISYNNVLEENRLLYNQIQDLKGTIRVYCRVRPSLSSESAEHSVVDYIGENSVIDYIGENGDIMVVDRQKHGKEARKIFSFSKVFGENVTQEQIYADTQPLIRSVLDGFNVCIFAYGQTGSGKTYTMSGPDLTIEETWGVNYRALRDLFHFSSSRMDLIEYEVGVQMIEIYNEQVRDLLVLDGANHRYPTNLNGLNVPDASLFAVRSTEDVVELMKIGQTNRAVGATALNERSSRSHSILTVHVHGRELVSGSTLKGCLHLVDLAGSERVDKSEVVGERLKEAQHINKSLSALGDVISALAQKNSHIPYRNSKLTQVLQNSLGGQAKTLMFMHINPEAVAIDETISTLNFAERVASVHLGMAQSNKETGEIKELKEEISNLKTALEKKEIELDQLRSGVHIRGMSSPIRGPRNNTTAGMKPENRQKTPESRSSSSGKQRKSEVASKFMDQHSASRTPSPAGQRLTSANKARSPSPPIRRSLSTERGSLIKGRVKTDSPANPPVKKVLFPARVPESKGATTITPATQSTRINIQGYKALLGPAKKDNISETYPSQINFRNVQRDSEKGQFQQKLDAREGSTRKSKPETKVRIKDHVSAKTEKSGVAAVLLSDTETIENKEEAQNGDVSDRENELNHVQSARSLQSEG